MARENPRHNPGRAIPSDTPEEIATDPDRLDALPGGPYADVLDESGDNLQTEDDESDTSFEDAFDDEDDTLTSGGGVA
jgi:hypothetical protein